ncbi:LSM domain-containing protein [Thermogladius sp. 4427co]|uniref:LSM domain-containing protein n=1 Tax=Thermogladius sp. 4427co TaxID=3450718 RepID=UPI003F7B1D9D
MANQARSIRNPSPLKILRGAINQVVLVRVKDGNEFIGNLEVVDPTMNVVLSDCEETTPDGKPVARYGKALIRGSHIVFISVNYGQVAPERARI